MGIAFRAGANSAVTAKTIALATPAGTAQGDSLVAFILTAILGDGGSSWETIPDGWVNHGYATSPTGGLLWCFTKTAGASEPVSYSWTFAESTFQDGVISGYSGDPIIAAVVPGAGAGPVNNYDPPAVPVAESGDIVIGAWAQNSGSAPTPPAGTTQREIAGTALMTADFTATGAGSQQPGDATGASASWVGWSVLLKVPVPLAPTLLSPAPNAALDLAAGATFSEQYNTGGATGGETKYHFRRKASGGSYEYWNATSGAWQGTDVANTSVNPAGTSLVFGAGHWTDGTVYTWSMASEDSNGVGTYAPDQTVVAQAPPTVSVTSPTGTVTDTAPTIAWTATPASGCAITNYRLVVYSAAQYGAVGFTPGEGPSVYDSGLQGGNPGSAAPDLSAANGLSLRAYVQVLQTGGQASVWQFSAFALAANPPATPSLTVTPVTDSNGRPRLYLFTQGHDNLLTAQRASMDDGATAWPVSSNASVSVLDISGLSPPYGLHYGLAIDSLAAGSASASDSAGGTAGWAVVPSASYTVMGWVRALLAPVRSVELLVKWFQASGAASAHPSDSTSVVDSTTAWTEIAFAVTAPADAAFATLVVEVIGCTAAGEDHTATALGIFPGAVSDWSAGGYIQAGVSSEFQRSDDGGTTFADVRNGIRLTSNPGEASAMDDYEAIPNETTYYRARTVSGNIASPWSAVVSAELVNSSWDVIDPVAGEPALGLHRVQTNSSISAGAIDLGPVSIGIDRPEVQGQFRCLGRSTYVVTRGDLMEEEFDLGVVFYDDEDVSWQAFDALRSKQVTVLLRGDMPGQRYYVAFGANRPMQLLRSGDRLTRPKRGLLIHCYPVPVP